MKFQQIVKDYLQGLQSGDISKILSTFEKDAVVNSPLYGRMKADEFYKSLESDTNQSVITLINVLESYENKNTCAGHFKYEWTLKDGTIFPFICVDIFEMSDDNKIKELTIVYDTAGVRNTFSNVHK